MFGKKNIGKIKVFSIFVAMLFCGGVFIFRDKDTPLNGNVAISYDGKSFSPQKVTIKKNAKVSFVNLSEKDFWPASDFHPNNGVYQEFDPKRPIPAGATWEFTFEKVGEWGYHDHLSAFHRGVIVVADKEASSTNSGCNNLADLDYQGRELCWYRQMKAEIKKRGVDGALKLLTKLYSQEPLFGQGCHDVLHLVGDEAYREYKSGKKFIPGKETTYCGYGFYHGFIEAMLYTTGDYDEVRSFCESLEKELSEEIDTANAVYSCYHGIGHSTFDIHDSSLWGDEVKMVFPAIETCEKATQGLSDEKIKQCVTGVYNALGNAYSAKQYNLKMNTKDPTWLCRIQKPLYKKSCFIDLSLAWIATTMGGMTYNFNQAAKFIGEIGDMEGEETAILALSSDYTRIKISEFDPVKMIEECHSIKKSLFTPCIKGMGEGLLLAGKPEQEYKLVFEFCNSSAFNDEERDFCFSYVLQFFSSLYSQEKKANICRNELDNKYLKYCNLD